jgi:hypothetical protein
MMDNVQKFYFNNTRLLQTFQFYHYYSYLPWMRNKEYEVITCFPLEFHIMFNINIWLHSGDLLFSLYPHM